MGYTTLNLIIIGPEGVGKSTFIRTFRSANQPEQPEHDNFAKYEVDDKLQLYLFVAPLTDLKSDKDPKKVLPRSDVWEILAEGMVGFVAIVDCTRPDTFPEAKEMISVFKRSNPTPYVVAANRYDRPDATDVSALRQAFEIADASRIIPCNVTQQLEVKAVLMKLLNIIVEA